MKKRTAIISLLAAAVLTLNAIPALATDGQGQVSPLDQLTQQPIPDGVHGAAVRV